jgi:hypothetical protein
MLAQVPDFRTRSGFGYQQIFPGCAAREALKEILEKRSMEAGLLVRMM